MSKRAEKLVADLKSLDDVQRRIDRVAEDFASAKHDYKMIDAWQLSELLGLNFRDTADWHRSFWTYRNLGDEDCPHFEVASTTVSSLSGVELAFEVRIGDAGEPFDPRTPYEIRDGKGFDSSKFIEIN